MDTTQTQRYLLWVNQHDPRIEPSPINADIWAEILAPYPAEHVKTATLAHYRATSDKATPAAIRALIRSHQDHDTARARALEPPAPTPAPHPATFRARNPELWDRLHAQGKADRDADLRHRGITP